MKLSQRQIEVALVYAVSLRDPNSGRPSYYGHFVCDGKDRETRARAVEITSTAEYVLSMRTGDESDV